MADMKSAIVIFVVGSCIATACRAAGASPVPENLLACARMPDPMVRVRCYDAQIAAMTQAAAGAPTASVPPNARASSAAAIPPAAVVPPTAVVPPAAAITSPAPSTPSQASPVAQSPATKFGEEQLPSTARAPSAAPEEALVSSITAVRPIRESVYLITLANGQVWRQDGSQVTAFFRVGNEVRIERGAFGSYHMSVVALGAKNWVLVKRIS
jgi:hypothetical protein